MDTSVFENNTATLYAPDIGSFPSRIIAISEEQF